MEYITSSFGVTMWFMHFYRIRDNKKVSANIIPCKLSFILILCIDYVLSMNDSSVPYNIFELNPNIIYKNASRGEHNIVELIKEIFVRWKLIRR